MDNGVKAKNSGTKFFTVEFFGVTLIITSVLLLVCLLFGKDVLFVIGEEVQYFLLGVFGYFSYPLLCCLIYVGFMMLFGKKIIKSNVKRKTVIAILFIFLLLCLLNVITSLKSTDSLSEYLKYGYESGRNGLSGVVAGGIVISFFTYPFVAYLSYVGAIIAFSLFIIFLLYVAIKKRPQTENVVTEKEYPGTIGESNSAANVNANQNAVNNANGAFTQNSYNNAYNGGYNGFNNQQNYNGNYNQNNAYGAQNNGFGNQNGGYNPNANYGYPNNGGNYNYNGYLNNGYVNPYDGNRYGANAYEPTPEEEARRRESMRILYGQPPVTYSAEYNNAVNNNDRMRFGESTYNGAANESSGVNGISKPISKADVKPSFDYRDTTSEGEVTSVNLYGDVSNEIDDSEGNDDNTSSALGYEEYVDDEQNSSATNFFTNLRKQDVNEYQGVADEIEDEKPVNTVKPSVTPSNAVNASVNAANNVAAVNNSSAESVTEQRLGNIIENMPVNYKYTPPPISLFKTVDNSQNNFENEIFKNDIKGKILTTLKTFGVETTIANVFRGPAVTRFDIVVPPAMSMSRIVKLSDDLNLRIAAKSAIRMVAPVPNTSYIGIEVPNQKADSVSLKDIISSDSFIDTPLFSLYFAFGKDIIGNPVSLNLADMPHVLISGTTGSGKSVCLNSMILSMISKYGPDQLRFVIVDPKQVDFEPFRDLPHMMFNTIIDNDLALCNSMLTWAVEEMERRYAQLKVSKSKNIGDFNRRAVQNKEKIMPRIVIIIDEFADLMMRDKKGIGEKICLLAQKSRAAGIHLVLAAQRPSADVVNGPIKANLPARLVFRASSHIDSTVSLGETGAEKLLGKGDCLYKTGGMLNTERAMGAYVSDDELYDIVEYVCKNNVAYYDFNAWAKIKSRVEASSDETTSSSSSSGGSSSPINVRDGVMVNGVPEVYVKAMRVGFDYGGLSVSSLQRRLGLGYPKAAKVVDWLVDNGYLAAESVHGKKQLLISKEEFEEKFSQGDDSGALEQ